MQRLATDDNELPFAGYFSRGAQHMIKLLLLRRFLLPVLETAIQRMAWTAAAGWNCHPSPASH
jgi:hypothetical protein